MKTGLIIPKTDGRGRHTNRRQYSQVTVNFIREHIEAIPKYISHYSRQSNPNKVYLDCDMSINELYRKYCVWILDKENLMKDFNPNDEKLKHLFPVSEDKYRKIFCTEYNIGFKLPRSDTCKTFDKLRIDLYRYKDDPEIVAKLKIEQQLHHEEAAEMFNDLTTTSKNSKESQNYDVISLDLSYCGNRILSSKSLDVQF